MKCNKCGEYAETAGEIRACAGCHDGTSAQVPGDVASDMPISTLINSAPGLANRFVPGSKPGTEPAVAAAPAAEPAAKPARKKKGA